MAKPQKYPIIEFEGRKYYRTDVGSMVYYRTQPPERRYLHRDMWVSAHGPIPDGMDIHHLNGDGCDNRMENFSMLSAAVHMRQHIPAAMAAAFGRLGGRVKSEAKSAAARLNGRRGGRPRIKPVLSNS